MTEGKINVDLDPNCDEVNILERIQNLEEKDNKSDKLQYKYYPASFVFNEDKISYLQNLGGNRLKQTHADCVINALDAGGLINADQAGLMRLVLRRCEEVKDEKYHYVGIGDDIIEEMISFISETHGYNFYYKIVRYSIDNIVFLAKALELVEVGDFLIISYEFPVDRNTLSHVVIIRKEKVDDAIKFFIYDQQKEYIKTPLTDEYFSQCTNFGIVMRTNGMDARRKQGFYGNICGYGPEKYLTINQTHYKEEKIEESKMFLGDIFTGTAQVSIIEKYKETIFRMHENCFKESVSDYITGKDYMEKLFETPGRFCYVLHPNRDLRENRLMAFCFIHKKVEEGQEYFYISDVCINPDYRRRNVCVALIKYVTKFYQSTEFLVLDVLQFNEGAIKCYDKLGFSLLKNEQFSKLDVSKSQSVTIYSYKLYKLTNKCQDTGFHEYINEPKWYFLTPGGEYYKIGLSSDFIISSEIN